MIFKSNQIAPSTHVQRIVHGPLNRRTIRHPPRAARYHSPPAATSILKHRETEDTEKNDRGNIIGTMKSSAAWFRRHDHLEARSQPKQTSAVEQKRFQPVIHDARPRPQRAIWSENRAPNEFIHDERRQPQRAIQSERRRSNETYLDERHRPKETI